MRIEYFYCLGGFKFLRRSSMYPSNNTAFLDVHEMSSKSNNSEGNVNWKTVAIYAVFLGVILSFVSLILLIFFVIYQIRSAGERERNSTRNFYNGIASIGMGMGIRMGVTQQPVHSTNNHGSMNDQQTHSKPEEPLPDIQEFLIHSTGMTF